MTICETAAIPRIVSGTAAVAQLPHVLATICGARAAVLLVADPGLAGGERVQQLVARLTAEGFDVGLFSAFASDPALRDVDAAVAVAKGMKARLVVSLGGGSAIDLGKAVAAIACSDAPAADYELCKMPFPASRLASVCLPTTSGTGAETTRTSVLSRADKTKVWLWGDALKPDCVILDPELTMSLPAHLTAATGIDALVHAIEAATNRNANASINLFAHEAIRLCAAHLERAISHPEDVIARAGMQRAAALAGIAIDNCGTALAHNIGHAIASLQPMHHGLAVGLSMMVTLPWNVEVDDGAFAACSAAMGGKREARECATRFMAMAQAANLSAGFQGKLRGLKGTQIAEQMAAPENQPMLANNTRAVDAAMRLHLAEQVLDLAGG